jgi:filamentous hemagglutinin family protein
MKKLTHHFWSAGLVFLCFLAKTELTQAQIASDETLSTQVLTINNHDFNIINGKRAGSNLFHSFREFSVPTGGTASFTNDLDVKNIISRVTGSSISNIDGLLKTNGSANFFLINPNGIIFGPNASLNINGSFLVSTASHLLFADGTQFSATNSQTPPLLSVSVPIGLQFGQTARPIEIERSNLKVQPGKTLAMLGGDVLIRGGELGASAGRIELGSVTANSLVSLTPIPEGWAMGYDGVQNFQDIQVSQAAFVYTDGEGHGAIQLHGREIAITDRSEVGGITEGEKSGQPLVIKAYESVEVSGSSQLRTLTLGTGAAGDIKIETRRLIVRNNGYINALTGSSGLGGNLTVDASESVEILGGGFATSLGTRTYGTRNDAGQAGIVQISTRRVILRDGGQILTSTLGAGKGGILRVDASESVEASGRSVADIINLPSGLFAESRRPVNRSTKIGDGGDLIINTQRLVVQGGASISVGALNGSTGQAGKLDINASDSVRVTGTGIDENGQVVPSTLLAASESSGSAGDLSIYTRTLAVRDGAAVSVSNTGSGKAGNLEITASNLLLDNQGKLTAETTGGLGNINLHTGDLILRRGSSITTNATRTATGGNITIDTDNLVAVPNENSDISANAEASFGGRVIINAQGIFGTQFRDAPTPLSDITASSERGPQFNGIVQLNTLGIDPNRGLINLPTAPVDTQVSQVCQAGVRQNQNSFIITGRGGLPPNPRQVLRSQAVQVDWVTLDAPANNPIGNVQSRRTQRQVSGEHYSQNVNNVNTRSPKIVEAQGWVVDANGKITLVATAPTANPHSPWFTPASCPVH